MDLTLFRADELMSEIIMAKDRIKELNRYIGEVENQLAARRKECSHTWDAPEQSTRTEHFYEAKSVKVWTRHCTTCGASQKTEKSRTIEEPIFD